VSFARRGVHVTDYAALLAAIHRVFPACRLEPVAEPELAAISRRFPGVPEHYLDFLRHVGWGSLVDNFMLYGGLVEPDEIFDAETAAGLAGIVFLGDNFAGEVVGFDTRDGWRLVGFDNSFSPVPDPQEARTLAEFIAERIAYCEPGEPEAPSDRPRD
jgi:hypothetical protein